VVPELSPLTGVGVGLRARHYREFIEQRPAVDWLEALIENHLQPGGIDRHALLTLREHYPCSLHGVGLGLGSAKGFSEEHLRRIVDLVRDVEPALVSEHLCWTSVAGRHLSELLPLPFSEPALQLLCERVDRVQQSLKRSILLENISTYLRYRFDAMSEVEFLSELSRRTGCGILLDVNNLYVNQCNHDEPAREVLKRVRPDTVGEIHLGGHLVTPGAVVDSHGDLVAEPVWDLYRAAIRRVGAVPTLIEWDTDIPELHVLLAEAERARAIVREAGAEERLPARRDAVRLDVSMSSGASSRELPTNVEPPAEIAALQSAFANGLFASTAPGGFRGDTSQTVERFSRYRDSLVATWEKSLAGAFPVVQRLVGDECFAAMSRDFGLAHPAATGDVNAYGAEFPEFVGRSSLGSDYPYFLDVARLEWAVQRAYYAADDIALLPQALLRLTPEALDSAEFKLRSACGLLDSPWAIADIWHAHQTLGDVVLSEALDVPSYVLVCRPAWRPLVVALSAASHRFLQLLADGESFGDSIDAALALETQFDVTAQLQQCLALQLLQNRAA